MGGLQVGAHQRAGVVAEALRPKGHIDGDDQCKRGGDYDVHRGRDCPYRIDQHCIDACSDLVQQLLPVDTFQPVHQPAHVGILCVEIGGPAGDIGLDLYIQAVEGLHQLRDQQRQGQNAARQNGQYQIYQLCGKDQNVRKPQQCYKKRYPYHGNEQRLFCFWFHKKSFPGRLWQQAAKKPSAGSFWYCNRKKRACQDEGKGKRDFIKAVCENVGGSFSAREKRGILGQSKFKKVERNTA